MTIKETVKQALTQVPGNQPIHIDDLWMIVTAPQGEAGLILNRQIKRALRDIPYVRKLADGRYVVKGRRVPPKVETPTQPIDPTKNGPLTLETLIELDIIKSS
jgi:hypothetical protein